MFNERPVALVTGTRKCSEVPEARDEMAEATVAVKALAVPVATEYGNAVGTIPG